MKRRRAELFEQPSLVPMADMVTNTVGIMLFILIFVSLSAGGAVVARHVPREKHTDAKVVWMVCSGGRIVQFDAADLGRQLEKPLGQPSFYTAREWARGYSAQKLETDTLEVSGKADAEFTNDSSGRTALIRKYVLVRPRPNQGEDAIAIRSPGSAFQKLLAVKNKAGDFFFFFVSPDSIPLFRAARDRATQSGFEAGWSPLGPGEAVKISLSGSGREATIQ
jgi:hypothetical protein